MNKKVFFLDLKLKSAFFVGDDETFFGVGE